MINWCDVLGWNEDHLSELRFLGYLYVKEARYEEARQFFEGLALLDQRGTYDLRMLGAIYLLKKDYPKSIEILTSVLEKEPDHMGAQLNLAKARLYQGEREAGLALLKKLQSCPQKNIAGDAEALVLAYSNA